MNTSKQTTAPIATARIQLATLIEEDEYIPPFTIQQSKKGSPWTIGEDNLIVEILSIEPKLSALQKIFPLRTKRSLQDRALKNGYSAFQYGDDIHFHKKPVVLEEPEVAKSVTISCADKYFNLKSICKRYQDNYPSTSYIGISLESQLYHLLQLTLDKLNAITDLQKAENKLERIGEELLLHLNFINNLATSSSLHRELREVPKSAQLYLSQLIAVVLEHNNKTISSES